MGERGGRTPSTTHPNGAPPPVVMHNFPQMCMNLDRESVYRQWELPFEHAMKAEFAYGISAVAAEGQSGAAKFAAGAGRGGSFKDHQT